MRGQCPSAQGSAALEELTHLEQCWTQQVGLKCGWEGEAELQVGQSSVCMAGMGKAGTRVSNCAERLSLHQAGWVFERKRQVWHSMVDLRVTIVIVAGAGGWWRSASHGCERGAGRAAGRWALGTQQDRQEEERQAHMTHRKST